MDKNKFHIDTGAEVTLITESMYEALGSPKISKSECVLRGPGYHKLLVQGMLRVVLALKDQQTEQEVYVLTFLQRPLLGQPAKETLQLLSRVRSVQKTTRSDMLFPRLFRGLGKLSGNARSSSKKEPSLLL